MQRYIVVYYAPLSVAARFAQATSEEAQQGVQHWIDWAAHLGPALVDPGKPLGHAIRVTKTGRTTIASTMVGMSILQANSMDEAYTMVKNHHHLNWADDCDIVVLEEMPIPEMASGA